MTFRWRPGDPPPAIEEHSKAKLHRLAALPACLFLETERQSLARGLQARFGRRFSGSHTKIPVTKVAVRVKCRPRVTQHGGATRTTVEE